MDAGDKLGALVQLGLGVIFCICQAVAAHQPQNLLHRFLWHAGADRPFGAGLDAHLNISKVYVKTEYGEQTARLTSREQLEQGQAFVKRHNDQDAADRVALGNVRYDLVGKLVEETGLTRATIAAILQGIAPLVFAQYKLNPEDFIIKAGKIINNQKADMIIEHITYNRLEESYSADIFMLANLHGRQGVNAMPADRSLYNYVIYDSDNERRFAHEPDVCDKIAVYVKLPGNFSSARR